MNAGDQLGHYTIVSHLGTGGMGAVYRATDTTLGRDVALKVLPGDVASTPDRLERFRREARALASLNHPHIVTVYSVEHIDGVHFLTMELVTGQSLDHLINGRPLPLSHLLKVGNAVAEALSAAHERGIVHRDLKPANVIMNDSGQVKVLDFGLAKVQTSSIATYEAQATLQQTVEGVVLGTPAYMSPEQVSGVIDLDHRTDIFSLGVLLYEMATGTRPFKGQSTADLSASILRDTPRSASEVTPSVPKELAQAIARCLEKNASSRFATMADLRAALQPKAKEPLDATPSIAVIPFQNLSADPENEFFSDGLAEEILNALAHIEGLRVAARTSAFSFKGKSASVAEIGSTLKVATVLEGSVRRAGNKVRVTVQLVDVSSGFQRWSERYDREMADIFDVQDEIAKAIAEKLKVSLTSGQASRIVKRATENLEAYELLLRGRALLLKRGKAAIEATKCFQRATELDPKYAAAWAALADAYTVQGYYGQLPPGQSMPKGLTAARRSVQLDPNLAEGQCALAASLMLWERDFEGADAAFRRCIELNPQYTQGRCWHALFNLLWVRGQVQEALGEARLAVEHDPLSAYATTILAMVTSSNGQTREGLEFARLGVQRDPDAHITNWIHGLAAHWHGALEESASAFQRCMEVSDRQAMPVAHLAMTYADMGKMAEARALIEELQARSTHSYSSNSLLMVAAIAIGDHDLAIEAAHQACDEREPLLILYARIFPDTQRLRDDPRFGDVIRRLRLPE
jgi:serine/threonine protein kinase/tetratricopeptide (TPR) repeat protein